MSVENNATQPHILYSISVYWDDTGQKLFIYTLNYGSKQIRTCSMQFMMYQFDCYIVIFNGVNILQKFIGIFREMWFIALLSCLQIHNITKMLNHIDFSMKFDKSISKISFSVLQNRIIIMYIVKIPRIYYGGSFILWYIK